MKVKYRIEWNIVFNGICNPWKRKTHLMSDNTFRPFRYSHSHTGTIQFSWLLCFNLWFLLWFIIRTKLQFCYFTVEVPIVFFLLWLHVSECSICGIHCIGLPEFDNFFCETPWPRPRRITSPSNSAAPGTPPLFLVRYVIQRMIRNNCFSRLVDRRSPDLSFDSNVS